MHIKTHQQNVNDMFLYAYISISWLISIWYILIIVQKFDLCMFSLYGPGFSVYSKQLIAQNLTLKK